MKLTTCFLLLVLLVFIVSFGCKGESTETAGEITATEEAADISEEPIKLTMWDDKSSEEEANVIASIIERWNAENPDVIIERSAVDIESYKMKIKTAIAANEAPDIFYSYGGGFSKPFIDAGKILALDEYISEEFKDKALPGAFTYSTYDGKLYGIPFIGWVGVLYCNQELFDEYQVEIPTTFNELMDVCKKFRDNGIGALGVGVSEKWTAMFYHNILALRTAGADLCLSALSKEDSFEKEEFVSAVEKLEELVNANAFNDGSMGMNYDEMTTLFGLGEIPMVYQGNWLAGQLEGEESPVKGKIVVVNFPVVEGGNGAITDFLGGSVDIYMASNNTEYKEEVAEALQYICLNYSKDGFEDGKGVPVFDDEFDETKVDRLSLDIFELTKQATDYVLAWDTFLEGSAAETHLDLVQEVFAGMISPEEFCQEMQKLNSEES